MVGSIPHAIAIGMFHVVCKDITHGHVICCFDDMNMLSQNHRKLQFMTIKCQKLLSHGINIKRKVYVCGACEDTPLIGSQTAPQFVVELCENTVPSKPL